MLTATTPSVLFNHAAKNLNQKTRGRKRLTRHLIKVILQEEKKNPNYQLAIAKLITLLEQLRSIEQEQRALQILAQRMSEMQVGDMNILEHILLSRKYSTHPVLNALCWTTRYMLGLTLEFEREAITHQISLLKVYDLVSPFMDKILKDRLLRSKK